MRRTAMSPLMMVALIAPVVVLATGPANAESPATPQNKVGEPPVVTEYKAIQDQLALVRNKAMNAPALQKELASLNERIDREMRNLSPSMARKMNRFHLQRRHFNTLRAQRRDEEAAKMAPELMKLESEIQKAREQVLESKAVKSGYEAFDKSLVAEMTRIEPKTPQWIARIDVLTKQIEALAEKEGKASR